MRSILKLMPLIREGAQNANGTSKSKRHFLDFVVDGKIPLGGTGETPRHGINTLR
jgi:hypothetical protein